VAGHAYVLKNVTADRIQLYNPWGSDHIELLFTELKTFLYRFYIQ